MPMSAPSTSAISTGSSRCRGGEDRGRPRTPPSDLRRDYGLKKDPRGLLRGMRPAGLARHLLAWTIVIGCRPPVAGGVRDEAEVTAYGHRRRPVLGLVVLDKMSRMTATWRARRPRSRTTPSTITTSTFGRCSSRRRTSATAIPLPPTASRSRAAAQRESRRRAPIPEMRASSTRTSSRADRRDADHPPPRRSRRPETSRRSRRCRKIAQRPPSGSRGDRAAGRAARHRALPRGAAWRTRSARDRLPTRMFGGDPLTAEVDRPGGAPTATGGRARSSAGGDVAARAGLRAVERLPADIALLRGRDGIGTAMATPARQTRPVRLRGQASSASAPRGRRDRRDRKDTAVPADRGDPGEDEALRHAGAPHSRRSPCAACRRRDHRGRRRSARAHSAGAESRSSPARPCPAAPSAPQRGAELTSSSRKMQQHSRRGAGAACRPPSEDLRTTRVEPTSPAAARAAFRSGNMRRVARRRRRRSTRARRSTCCCWASTARDAQVVEHRRTPPRWARSRADRRAQRPSVTRRDVDDVAARRRVRHLVGSLHQAPSARSRGSSDREAERLSITDVIAARLPPVADFEDIVERAATCR